MSDVTPLEKLDDAVRQYLQEIGWEGDLTSWVLGFQTSMLSDQPALLPLVFASDFTMGAATSPETAIGLFRLTEAKLLGYVIGAAE